MGNSYAGLDTSSSTDPSDFDSRGYKYLDSLIEAENDAMDDDSYSEMEPTRKRMTMSPKTEIGTPQMMTLKIGMPPVDLCCSDEVDGDLQMSQQQYYLPFQDIDPSQHDLPFENIVFEGGGNKGLAHCGVLKYLEEIELMPKIRRIAGTSAGSIMATLVAVGYNADRIREEMGQNMKDMFLDGSYFGMLRNLFYYYGMHHADVIYDWLGDRLSEKVEEKDTEKKIRTPADITFDQVLKLFGRELCVVVTNLNLMTTEYCHPKTTPHMPVRQAVRMSTSIPGMFTAKTYALHGDEDVFVDGGVLCNYPIHCFDGWYLSLDTEDRFYKRSQDSPNLQPDMHKHKTPLVSSEDSFNHRLKDRFKHEDGLVNMKTLGISLYAENEEDLLKDELEKIQLRKPYTLDTELYGKWEKTHQTKVKAQKVLRKRGEAIDTFWEALRNCTGEDNDEIKREDIEKAFDGNSFLGEQKKLILGSHEPNEVFDRLDTDKTGTIQYKQLGGYLWDLGIKLHKQTEGCRRSDINSVSTFLSSIESTLLINLKRNHVKDRDAQRTVGVNTGHVETTDFDLEEEDKDFLIERGYSSCKTFLQHCIDDKNVSRKLNGVVCTD